MFCVFSRSNQGMLLQIEKSFTPIVEYHQIWMGWTFFITVGSISRWQEWVTSAIWLGLHIILHCWNQTQVKLYKKRSKYSWRSKNGFFRICEKWIETKIYLSQSSWLMSNFVACSPRVWHWVSCSKIPSNSIYFLVLISRNKFLIFALFWEALFSKAPIKNNEVMSIRVAKDLWFFNVWWNGNWYWDMFPYLDCFLWPFECLLLGTNWLKIEKC